MAWIGNVLFVLAVWQAGRKQRLTFVSGGSGNALYAVHAYSNHDWALLSLSLILLLMSVDAWVRWGKHAV